MDTPLSETIPISQLFISDKNVRKQLVTTDDDDTTINTLAQDIDQNGLINLLSVRRAKDNMYEIYAGQRRFLAIKQLGWTSVPCTVVDENTSDEKIQLRSLAENIQRIKMTQRDKCETYHTYYRMCGCNMTTVSEKVSLSEKTVSKYIALKEGLASKLFDALDAKDESKLCMETAIALAKHIPVEHQESVFFAIQTLGSPTLKKQAILEYVKNPGQSIDVVVDKVKVSSLQTMIVKEASWRDDTPWVYNDLQEPIKIPPELYIPIRNLISAHNSLPLQHVQSTLDDHSQDMPDQAYIEVSGAIKAVHDSSGDS